MLCFKYRIGMAIIAVNTKYVYIPELSISQFLKDGSQGEFKIESTERNLPIDVGNNIVFIKPQLSDLVFTNSGTIQKIGKRDFLPGKPVDLLNTAEGIKLVEQMIGRIQHGVHS